MHGPQIDELALGMSDEDIRDAFAPYLGRTVAEDDPDWDKIISHLTGKWRRRRWRRQLLGWFPGVRHDQRNVERVYSRTWSEIGLAEKVSPGATNTPTSWRGNCYLAGAQGTKRVHLLYLMRILSTLRPRTVCEVGCGNGLNLLVLANRFPDMAFSGVELTSAGVAVAKSGTELETLPRELVTFSPEPLAATGAHRNVTVQQGSAAALPFDDGSVDCLFTVLALEQMEEIRHQALTEIARVAGRHVIMIEPWRDWNETGIRRDSIVARDYFQARVADLRQYGLEPVYTCGDIPSKVIYGVGVVVARRIDR